MHNAVLAVPLQLRGLASVDVSAIGTMQPPPHTVILFGMPMLAARGDSS